jgi:hypothetical protein
VYLPWPFVSSFSTTRQQGSSPPSTRYRVLAPALAVAAVRTRSEACLLIHLFFLHDSKFVHTQNRFPKGPASHGPLLHCHCPSTTILFSPGPSPSPSAVSGITRSAGSCRVFDALPPYATHRAQSRQSLSLSPRGRAYRRECADRRLELYKHIKGK